jgi:hypothetical protein
MSNIWQDSSAIFNTDTNLNTDTLTNCNLTSLTYDTINNRIYAGGMYDSSLNSPTIIPYVSWSGDGGINWQDSSAIFNTDTNLNTHALYCALSSLTYDASNNRIYAGGNYSSNLLFGTYLPYVSWSGDGGLNWQDSSAIFNTDTNLNTDTLSTCNLTSLTYDSSNNRIYAGGYYNSKLNYPSKDIPFVSSSIDGVNWQDSSAIFNTDTNLNTHTYSDCLLYSLTYNSSNNRIYAGGTYNSIVNSSKTIPFVSSSIDGINWQDSSAIFNTDTNLNTDITNTCSLTSLTYDSSNNRIYAGGTYNSIANSGKIIPYVSWSGDGGVNWQDSSAIFNTDTNLHNDIINNFNFSSLIYDSSNNRIYAGGYYNSISNLGKTIPFVSSSIDGVNWQDSSGIFNTDTNLNTDITNTCSLTSLTYDSSNGRIYAGGMYDSKLNYPSKEIPFVSFNQNSPPPQVTPTPPYFSIEFTNTNIFLNGIDSGLPGLTYYLKVTDMSNDVTITNITSPLTQVNLKLWADFSNNSPNNIPPGEFFIDGSDITIDGQGLELDLTQKILYRGLIRVLSSSITNINIENINILIGNLSTLKNSAGWVCHGEIPTGCDISFNNCHVTSDSIMNLVYSSGADSFSGGICGGNSLINTNRNLSFTNCSIISNNDITLTTANNNFGGGICGGQNMGNYTFTNCNVKSLNGSLSITKTGMLVFNNFGGGICGGQNTGVFNFIECKVETENDITITSINHTNWGGGICGGRNNETQTLNSTFTNCQVNSLAGDIIINGLIANNGGGICGAETTTGTLLNSTYTFNLCFVNPFLDFIYSGVTISKPNNDRTTLKNKIMIGASNLISNDSNINVDCVSELLDNPVYVCNTPSPTPTPTPPTPSPLGGGTQGVSLKVLHLMEGGNSRAMTRRVLRSAFGNENNTNNKTRKCKTPFRVSVNEHCGTEKAPIIYSGADYIRFKKLKAENQTYNDKSYGGDNSHGSYVSLKRARN